MNSSDSGSVLLEALVSTAVVAAVLGAMFTAVGQWDQQRRQVDARRVALMIARSELAAVGALPLRPGRVEGLESGFVWSVTVEPVQANALDSSLAGAASTVTVTVRDASGGPDLATLRTQQLALSP